MKNIKNKIKNTANNAAKKIPVKKDGAGKWLILFLVILGIVIGRNFYLNHDKKGINNSPVLELSFSDILNNDVKTMNVRGDTATGTLADGREYRAIVNFDSTALTKMAERGTEISINNSKSFWEGLLAWFPLVLAVMFIFWIFRGLRRGGAKSLLMQNPTKITTGKSKTTFKDVAGIDPEKQELSEIVEFLKNREKFKAVGARVPRGVLLSGEPGTGKTLLARAVAGEANVPFFAVSGSDFTGIIVGLGVAKIKEIFEMAKRSAPCILFIDEIDAIGQKRARNISSDSDREATLNQLLIEMDGFANDNGIIVIGATNRPDMLDGALLRPGRFDRQVNIELPDLLGRKQILDLHAKKIKMAADVDLQDTARGTTGFSGADLENLLNEAALYAVRNKRREVTSDDLEEARDKVIMGPKKPRKMREEDIKLTAYHEAGHAFVSVHYRDITDPIHKATIIPRGRALGMVQTLPIDDKVSMTIKEIRANLSINLAGRASEEIFFGADKITTGAESDIAQSTRLARLAITVAGMSKKIGLAALSQVMHVGSRSALETSSEKTIQMVDEEVQSWLKTAHDDATKIITKNKKIVDKLATELLKRETLDRDEIFEIVLGKKTKTTKKKIKK